LERGPNIGLREIFLRSHSCNRLGSTNLAMLLNLWLCYNSLDVLAEHSEYNNIFDLVKSNEFAKPIQFFILCNVVAAISAILQYR